MRSIAVESFQTIPVEKQKVEIVERKGLGHPDSICDAVMDKISVELSKAYLNEFGHIQHHNIDKSLLVAGGTELAFGGGRVVEPMKLVIGDRATFEVGRKSIDVESIARKTAEQWFKKNMRFVENVDYQIIRQRFRCCARIASNHSQCVTVDRGYKH